MSAYLRLLQEQGNIEAASVIKNAELDSDIMDHDNWNGGIDFWELVLQLKYKDYVTIADKKDKIECDILTALNQFHRDERDHLVSVQIQPVIEQYIDWNAILPMTKEATIQLIQEEKKMLTDVATYDLSFKEDGVEETFQKRHQRILSIANAAGFDYPVRANTLVDWWSEVRELSSYAERREYISQKFSSLLKMLRESEDNGTDVSFQQIAARSGIVQKAVEDAEVFIREGRYDSAVDRVHTAFHGYLRQLLTEHTVAYGADDGLPSLFSKLHGYYGDSIQPSDVAERLKTIL